MIYGGKESELEIGLQDGRTLELGVDDVNVSVDTELQVAVSPVGEGTTRIEYLGSDLVLTDMRLMHPYREWHDEFARDLEAWLTGDRTQLPWAVTVECAISRLPQH